MRSPFFIIILLLCSVATFAQNDKIKKDSLPNYGTEIKKSDFFRERYQFNDLVNYLDNLNDYITYESETTGNFNLPDLQVFSVSGNSFKWNKYYLNGFRVDNRTFAGSSFFLPDLSTASFSLDYYKSILSFQSDSSIQNSLTIRYNIGGLGGISPYSEELIRSFHNTATDRFWNTENAPYNPGEYRSKMKGAGNVFLNYSIPIAGKKYTQQFYADFGTRMQVDFNQKGISDFYPENFSKVQLSGQLPMTVGNLFDNTNYLFNASQRQNLYTELYYSKNESANNNAFSFSFYGSKHKLNSRYTSGITLATNKIKHTNLNFSRNLIDQDGEAFEPWYPDGTTTELSHALNYAKNLSHGIQLTFDSYNSVINFKPSQNNFQNAIYKHNIYTSDNVNDTAFHSLYMYDWDSQAFTSGLIENTLGLKTEKVLSKSIDFKANLDLTFDGMIVTDKSMVRLNWQGQMGFFYHPAKWFSMELNLSKNRVSYNFDDIKYFSNEYMNGDIYYWKDNDNNKTYTENEKSSYLTSTGGKYHTAIKNLKQLSYFVFDIPMYFQFGRHQISLLNTYKKYSNNWTTRFDKAASEYGYTKNVDGQDIFFYNKGEINYIVDYYPESYMKSNILTNSPYYLSQTIKYQYTTKKFMYSMSWCSFLMAGISTLGNGPLHNNLGVYSETSANPNINYKLVGRLNQERAFVARIFLSYKVTENLSFALTAKFKDGQPFTNFNTSLATDNDGNNQLATWSHTTKGINVFDNDFGRRKDAFFNIDLRTSYKGKLLNNDYELQLMFYNLYDFGTELTEFTFIPDDTNSRAAMNINIPRGLMLTAKIYL